MNKYIFHGGGSTKGEIGNQTFFRELVKDVPENGTVLLVYFASREDDYTERMMYDTEKCNESTSKKLNIVVANKANFIQQVLSADAIYLRGGSTEKLINTLKEYPDFTNSLQNKNITVAGSSAGAYALSTLYSSHYEDIAAEGLGIVPVRVVTHYLSEKMPPREEAIKILKKTKQELPLVTLEETEWEIFNSK